MSTQIYYVSKQCGSGQVCLWPMSAYGDTCTSLADAEAKLAETVAAGVKGAKFSLETQKVVMKDGQVVKVEGAATVVKTATAN